MFFNTYLLLLDIRETKVCDKLDSIRPVDGISTVRDSVLQHPYVLIRNADNISFQG